MTSNEIRLKWPHLWAFLAALWYDTVGFPISKWKPNFQDTSQFDELEIEASRLLSINPDWNGVYEGDDSDWEKFAYGADDDKEMDRIVVEYGVQKLSQFLTDCFDGDLTEQFYQPQTLTVETRYE